MTDVETAKSNLSDASRDYFCSRRKRSDALCCSQKYCVFAIDGKQWSHASTKATFSPEPRQERSRTSSDAILSSTCRCVGRQDELIAVGRWFYNKVSPPALSSRDNASFEVGDGGMMSNEPFDAGMCLATAPSGWLITLVSPAVPRESR